MYGMHVDIIAVTYVTLLNKCDLFTKVNQTDVQEVLSNT